MPPRPGTGPRYANIPLTPGNLALLRARGVNPIQDPYGTITLEENPETGKSILAGDAAGQIGSTVNLPPGTPSTSPVGLIQTAAGDNREPVMVCAQFGVVAGSDKKPGQAFPSSARVQCLLQWGAGSGQNNAVVTLKRGMALSLCASSFRASVYRDIVNPVFPAADDQTVSVSVSLNYGPRGFANGLGPTYETAQAMQNPAAPLVFFVAAFAGTFSVLCSNSAALLLLTVNQRDKAGNILAVNDIRARGDAYHIPLISGAYTLEVSGPNGPYVVNVSQELSL